MKPEYKTTEFWAVVVGAIAWLIDINTGSNILDNIDIESVSEAKAQVIAIAADLRNATGSDSNLLIYLAGLIYTLKKSEKIVALIKEK